MGSLRRGLSGPPANAPLAPLARAQRASRLLCTPALATLTPTAAWAEVCDKVRPFWEPGAPATMWDEFIGLIATPPSLVLLVLSALVIRFRHQWGALLVVVLWSFWISYVTLSTPDGVRQTAMQEGCIGSPTLFIAVVAAICGGMIIYTSRRI